jgi:hypothetical protein
VRQVEPEAPATPTQQNLVFETFLWGGHFHMVPNDFIFPVTINVKTMWGLWYYGNKDTKIQPYRFIKGKLDLQIIKDRAALSKAKYVFSQLEIITRELNLLPHGATLVSLPTPQSDAIFDEVFPTLMQKVYINIEGKRIGEISYIRVYDLIKTKEKNNVMQNEIDPQDD